MTDDARQILDDLLADWHRWARGYRLASDISAQPMFKQSQSPRGWDSVQDIVESEIDGDTMAAINFHIFELDPIHCTAIQIHARNLVTGRAVWTSQRLPTDPLIRAALLGVAKGELTKRLMAAGVL